MPNEVNIEQLIGQRVTRLSTGQSLGGSQPFGFVQIQTDDYMIALEWKDGKIVAATFNAFALPIGATA